MKYQVLVCVGWLSKSHGLEISISSTRKLFLIPSAKQHRRISFEPLASLTITVRNLRKFLTLFLSGRRPHEQRRTRQLRSSSCGVTPGGPSRSSIHEAQLSSKLKGGVILPLNRYQSILGCVERKVRCWAKCKSKSVCINAK